MSRWIFQDIREIKDSVLYSCSSDKPLGERIEAYNAALREKVDPSVYVRYLINQCDIDVDAVCIAIAAQNVYKDLTSKQIKDWIWFYTEKHHKVYGMNLI